MPDVRGLPGDPQGTVSFLRAQCESISSSAGDNCYTPRDILFQSSRGRQRSPTQLGKQSRDAVPTRVGMHVPLVAEDTAQGSHCRSLTKGWLCWFPSTPGSQGKVRKTSGALCLFSEPNERVSRAKYFQCIHQVLSFPVNPSSPTASPVLTALAL